MIEIVMDAGAGSDNNLTMILVDKGPYGHRFMPSELTLIWFTRQSPICQLTEINFRLNVILRL
jgi:hypothetical protein